MKPTAKTEVEHPDRITHRQFVILLSAVRDTMEEQHLSIEKALEQLRLLIGPREIPPIVQESLDHLGAIDNEADLFWELGFESVRLMKL